MTPINNEWSMSMYNDHIIKILQSGKWWSHPWWLENQYFIGGMFEKIDVNHIFKEHLQIVFDDRWFLDQKAETLALGTKLVQRDVRIPSDFKNALMNTSNEHIKLSMCRVLAPIHPLFDDFLGSRRGSLVLSNLMELGRDLRVIRENPIPGIDRLVERLKKKDQIPGARFELFLIANLLQLGWKITLDPPSTKGRQKADIEAKKGSEIVCIELKRLESSRTNKDILAFEDWIRDYILRFVGMISAVLNLKLLPDCIEIAGIRSKTVNVTAWKKIADDIIFHIKENLKKQSGGHHVVSNIAEYDIRPLSPGHTGGMHSFSGFPIDQDAESKKIIQTAIDEAAGQLPVDHPGVIIIDTPFPIDESIVQTDLYSAPNSEGIKHVIGVILLFGFTALPGQTKFHISLVKNEHSFYKSEKFTVIKDILSLKSNELERVFLSDLRNGTQFDQPIK